MARQFRLYDPWMHRSSPHATFSMSLVESYRKEDICCLRSAIGYKRVIGCPLEIRIVQVDVGIAVTCRRHVNQASSRPDEGRNPVDQDKVAEMISPELRFEAVGGVAERCSHHSGIGDDHVEWFGFCEQRVSARTHAF